jgi:hypothetical protein
MMNNGSLRENNILKGDLFPVIRSDCPFYAET